MSGEIIRAARKARGVTLDALEDRTGIPKSTLSRIESGQRKLDADKMQVIATALDMSAADLFPARMVPIVGFVGAGPDSSVLFAHGDENFGEAPAPIDSSPNAKALEVRGDSMRGTASDGWLVFWDEREDPSDEHMGELCVCWLEDDRVLVKTPYPGRSEGLFDLESTNAPTMRDIPVRYFAIITDIKTRRSARKYIKRNPDLEIPSVKIAS